MEARVWWRTLRPTGQRRVRCQIRRYPRRRPDGAAAVVMPRPYSASAGRSRRVRSWRRDCDKSESTTRHYGNDNINETNRTTIVSVNMTFLQLADDNFTETGHQSTQVSMPRSGDDVQNESSYVLLSFQIVVATTLIALPGTRDGHQQRSPQTPRNQIDITRLSQFKSSLSASFTIEIHPTHTVPQQSADETAAGLRTLSVTPPSVWPR